MKRTLTFTICLLMQACLIASTVTQPTVTRAERDTITQAKALFDKEPAKAIALLVPLAKPEASAAIDFALASLYDTDNRPADAQAAYQTALKKCSTFVAAHRNLARLYLLQDKPAQAIPHYQALLRHQEPAADTYILLGYAFLETAAPVSAETAYRQALLFDATRLDAKKGLAQSLLAQSRYPEVIALTRELLNQTPHDSALWSLLINALLATDQPQQAATAIESAWRLNAATAADLATLTDLLINKRQPRDAWRAYQAAKKLAPLAPHRDIRTIQGLLDLNQIDHATIWLDAILPAIDTYSPAERQTIRLLQAKVAYHSDQPDRAKTICQEILQAAPLQGDALILLAHIHQDAGDRDQAITACRRAARITGYQVKALTLQAQIAVANQAYDEALRLLYQAQQIKPSSAVADYIRAIQSRLK